MIYMSFFIGLILICKGGDWFVDAASKLSEILGGKAGISGSGF